MSNGRIEIEKLLRTNKPVFCEECGGKLSYRSAGTYVCEKCGHEELDDFGKIKLFLDENGPSPIHMIAKGTGVTRDIIELYLKKGRIEIPEGSKYYLKCEKCGCSIRYGRYCPDCARELSGGIASLLNEEVGEKPKSANDSKMQGKVHYLNKR